MEGVGVLEGEVALETGEPLGEGWEGEEFFAGAVVLLTFLYFFGWVR